MIVDYHIHTPYCNHAYGPMAVYVEAAISAGLSEICFSDHLSRYYLSPAQKIRYHDWGIPQKLLHRYFGEVEALKIQYTGKICIRAGLEVDFVEGAEHLAARIIETYPCDFLLGSIHCLPSLGWHHLSQYFLTGGSLAYEKYFEAAHAALQSGLFQSIGHIDGIWRYIPFTSLMHEQLTAYIADVAATARKANVALEINAAGYAWSLDHAAPDYDPFEVLMNCIAQEQTAITLGSDAHSPEAVARYFPDIIPNLHTHGITQCSVFEGKKKQIVPLGYEN